MDKESLSHTRANCKYHIVFTPKYRRQVIYGQLRKDIGEILRTLCERKGVTIIETAACKDHIHMYVEIPPKYAVADIMGYLKGKSSLMIFERHANLKYKYQYQSFSCSLKNTEKPWAWMGLPSVSSQTWRDGCCYTCPFSPPC